MLDRFMDTPVCFPLLAKNIVTHTLKESKRFQDNKENT